MSTEKFAELVQGFCSLHKMDLDHVIGGGAIELGGMMCCLFHHSEEDSPLLMAYCDFGTVPQELEAQVHKRLLQFNLSAYTGQGETFCLTPDGHVLLVNNFSLDILTPELLTTHLKMIAFSAQRWREDYFLGEEGGPQSVPAKKKDWAGNRFMNKSKQDKK